MGCYGYIGGQGAEARETLKAYGALTSRLPDSHKVQISPAANDRG